MCESWKVSRSAMSAMALAEFRGGIGWYRTLRKCNGAVLVYRLIAPRRLKCVVRSCSAEHVCRALVAKKRVVLSKLVNMPQQ